LDLLSENLRDMSSVCQAHNRVVSALRCLERGELGQFTKGYAVGAEGRSCLKPR